MGQFVPVAGAAGSARAPFMVGRATGWNGWRGALALALVLAALLVRAAVPQGYMPAIGEGYAITLCTGQGATAAWVDGEGKVHKGQSMPTGQAEQSCAFAGMAAAFDLPTLGGDILAPLAPPLAPLAAMLPGVAVGRGLAAPPPPPTGPPASL